MCQFILRYGFKQHSCVVLESANRSIRDTNRLPNRLIEREQKD